MYINKVQDEMCYKKQMYDTLKMFAGLDTAEVELGKWHKLQCPALNLVLGIELGLDDARP